MVASIPPRQPVRGLYGTLRIKKRSGWAKQFLKRKNHGCTSMRRNLSVILHRPACLVSRYSRVAFGRMGNQEYRRCQLNFQPHHSSHLSALTSHPGSRHPGTRHWRVGRLIGQHHRQPTQKQHAEGTMLYTCSRSDPVVGSHEYARCSLGEMQMGIMRVYVLRHIT